jgi:hypothetical protein
MLALIPIAALLALVLLLGNLAPAWGWRRVVLRGSLAAGAYLVLTTEALSLASAITPVGVAATWGALLLVAVLVLIRRARKMGRLVLPRLRIPANWLDRVLLVGMIVVMAVTAIVAWYAPPNTWDSLNYHMPRVAHWAQDRSLRPFATGIEVQNNMGPAAEMVVLHLYVLVGGDRLANFAEWMAMALSLVGVAVVARQLGGRSPAGLIAALVAATLPSGIVQASSTMTDYVTAYWVLCAASETIALASDSEAPASILPWLSAAAGLAFLSKATAFPFLLPLGVWAAVSLLRRAQLRRAAGLAALSVLVVLLLNAGHLARTISIYGSILPGDRVATHSNELRDPRVLISNTLKNAGLHAGTPWPAVNRVLELGVLKIHQWMALDVNDPRTTTIGEFSIKEPSRAEDRAGNPAHAWLYLAVVALAIARRRKAGAKTLLIAGAAVAGFLVSSYLFKWQVFGVRLHMPFFVLLAPVAGVALTSAAPPLLGRLISLALLAASIPWLTGIEERPLLRNVEGARVPSILYEPRENLYIRGELLQEREELVAAIRGNGCSRVGIMLAGGAAEYPLWVFLGAPDDELEIEWIVSGTPSARFEDTEFVACAIICDSSCPQDWTILRGLPLAGEIAGYRLFLED